MCTGARAVIRTRIVLTEIGGAGAMFLISVIHSPNREREHAGQRPYKLLTAGAPIDIANRGTPQLQFHFMPKSVVL